MTTHARRGQKKMSKKELAELPLIESEMKIALCYMGEAKYNATAVSKLLSYSESHCQRTVKKPNVMKFIDEELQKLGIQTRAARNATINETLLISQSDIIEVLREVMDDGGHVDFAKVKRLPKRLSAAIKTVKIVEEKRPGKNNGKGEFSLVRTEIQMHEKVPALALLDRMLRISENPEDKPKEKEQLQLTGMIIEAPAPAGVIDAEFEIVEPIEEKELPEWLRL